MEQQAQGTLQLQVEEAQHQVREISQSFRVAIEELNSEAFSRESKNWQLADVTRAADKFAQACESLDESANIAADDFLEKFKYSIAHAGSDPLTLEHYAQRLALRYAESIETAFNAFKQAQLTFEEDLKNLSFTLRAQQLAAPWSYFLTITTVSGAAAWLMIAAWEGDTHKANISVGLSTLAVNSFVYLVDTDGFINSIKNYREASKVDVDEFIREAKETGGAGFHEDY